MAPKINCFYSWRLVYLLKFLRTPELNIANGDNPIHGHTGTLQLDARACDDPARGWSQEVAAESAAEEDVCSLGDVPGNKMEAYDDYDEMKKKKDDSSTTNWFKCGDYE